MSLLLAVWLLGRFAPAGFVPLLARSWLVFSGGAGLALLFFWFGTDHAVARFNLNVLLLNPLWLLLAFQKGHEKLTLQIVAGMSLLSLLATLFPPGQYNFDTIAAFAPLNLAAAFALHQRTGAAEPRPRRAET
jgi:hypothetical protein